MKRFAPGESVVWRSVDRKQRIVQTVWPWTVVEDRKDETVLFIPVGTVGKRRTGERGGPGNRCIASPYSLWLAFDALTWELAWRYINLEDPWLRTAIGFDSRDVYLDLVAGPDGDDWQWKDEDELAWVVEQGRIDAARALQIRGDGERAVTAIRELGSLDQWRTWRPDPGWRVPTVPARWREYEL